MSAFVSYASSNIERICVTKFLFLTMIFRFSIALWIKYLHLLYSNGCSYKIYSRLAYSTQRDVFRLLFLWACIFFNFTLSFIHPPNFLYSPWKIFHYIHVQFIHFIITTDILKYRKQYIKRWYTLNLVLFLWLLLIEVV